MRILLSAFGSRGDVEPLAALALALRALGVDAVVSTPPDQELLDLLARADVPSAKAFYSLREWMMRADPAAPAEFFKLSPEMLAGQHKAIGEAADGCDAILATGFLPSIAAAQGVAEKRGVSYFHVGYCPLFLPTHHHPPFSHPAYVEHPGVTDPRTLWNLNIDTMNSRYREMVNLHRTSLGLSPVDNVRDYVLTRRSILASDPVLWPWQQTDMCDAVQTGAWVLPDKRPLPAGLEAFLDAGSPPVYVGFGSIGLPTVRHAAETAVQAIKALGRRAVVARGWADVSVAEDSSIFSVGDVNQQALFPRVAAVVHHGGAGTTTAAARAGTSQIVVPQLLDQPYWGDRVNKLGIGSGIASSMPTFEAISQALETALMPETKAKAKATGGLMRTDGADIAAKFLVEQIETGL